MIVDRGKPKTLPLINTDDTDGNGIARIAKIVGIEKQKRFVADERG